MRNPWLVFAAGISFAAMQTQAVGSDIDLSGISNQRTFDRLIDQFGAVVSYNPVAPAEPLGTLGFEVGVAVSVYDLDGNLWDQAMDDGDAPSLLVAPRLMARKGLPFGIDVGASYVRVPSSNISIVGGELRKALLEGSAVTPALSVMGHYSRLNGVDALSLSSYGVDLSISKGFAMLTPYAGIGQIWYEGRERAGLGFDTRDDSQTRGYLGLRLGLLPLLSVTAQADFAEIDSYSLRFNLGF